MGQIILLANTSTTIVVRLEAPIWGYQGKNVRFRKNEALLGTPLL